MALQPVMSVGDSAVLYADVVAGVVVGARLDIPEGFQAEVDYTNGATVIMRGVFSGVQTVALAKNRQFTLATATGVRVSLTIRWPG